jgi:hypothetical protein
MFLVGALTLIAGILLASSPLFAASVLTIILAIYFIVDGIAEVAGRRSDASRERLGLAHLRGRDIDPARLHDLERFPAFRNVGHRHSLWHQDDAQLSVLVLAISLLTRRVSFSLESPAIHTAHGDVLEAGFLYSVMPPIVGGSDRKSRASPS